MTHRRDAVVAYLLHPVFTVSCFSARDVAPVIALHGNRIRSRDRSGSPRELGVAAPHGPQPREPLASNVEPCFVLAVLLIGDKQAIEIVQREQRR